MEKVINLYTYSGKRATVTVDFDTVEFLLITIVSGDELLCIKNKDGSGDCYDALELVDDGDFRAVGLFDGMYMVYEDFFDTWNAIDDVYDRQEYAIERTRCRGEA